ncbi:Cytochrome-c oxidase [Lentibacillus sp. JNUCC-1]|uniref:hypothetical protein n=1 Tax=Lentibacillus sp. JNUCC-1 TaxID=2654513 RepID=UPI0012E935B8|nr:hypothetical protein [Lentibacillus sp. JNUCC-1]MUV38392.1 Cytochrome-c oxidase [Lentibacillus sp. JNUCC-1]MUV38698.1 Cytochrome-c oxidase [Lentibacillus sp. JNUCC-1]
MIDAGWLNIGSLILGLVAWIIPAINLVEKKQKNNKWVTLTIISFSACAIAICFQIFYNLYLVKIEDFAALADTMRGVAVASTVLVIVTILLNVFTLFLHRNRGAL